MSDHASIAFAETSLPEKPRIYNAISKRTRVPTATLYHHDHKKPSKRKKAQGQQYLSLLKKKALRKYTKLIANFKTLVQIKYLASLAFCIAYQYITIKQKTNLLSKN